MKTCKCCTAILSAYEETYLKDICTNCVDEWDTEDDQDFEEKFLDGYKELDFSEKRYAK